MPLLSTLYEPLSKQLISVLGPQWALPHCPRYYGLMRQTTSLPQPVVVPRFGGLCRLLRAPAATWSFPTLSLRVCPSMHGPLPRRCGGCTDPLLPHHHRPSPSPHGVGFPRQSVQRLPNGRCCRGCSHSRMFRPRGLLPPRSLPPSCQDTRQPWRLRPSSTPVVTFRCIGYASRPNGQLTAGGLPPP